MYWECVYVCVYAYVYMHVGTREIERQKDDVCGWGLWMGIGTMTLNSFTVVIFYQLSPYGVPVVCNILYWTWGRNRKYTYWDLGIQDPITSAFNKNTNQYVIHCESGY